MPKTKKTARPKLEGPDACVAMHTALRKLCDSSITSAAYNLIHLICNAEPRHFNAWCLLGDLVAEGVAAGETPLTALRDAHRALRDNWEKRVEKHRKKGEEPEPAVEARAALLALYCVLECFEDDDDDWVGMAGYLADD